MTGRSEEHTSELQSHDNLVCRLLLEKKTQRRPAPPDHGPGQEPRPRRRRPQAPRPTPPPPHPAPAPRRAPPPPAPCASFFLTGRGPPDLSPFPLPDAFRI